MAKTKKKLPMRNLVCTMGLLPTLFGVKMVLSKIYVGITD